MTSASHVASRRGRNLGLVAFVITLLLAIIAVPAMAGASTFSAGFTVEHSGGRIQNDLYVAAFQAEITADVDGDVSLAAANTMLDSTVGGSVHVLAGTATIRGEIGGTLYVAGGITKLDGAVEGNVVVTGGRLELQDNASIGGDLTVFTAQARVDGDVTGKLYGSTLLYEQNGAVSGNVDLQSDRIELGQTATIGDDFNYQSQTDANIHVNVEVGGVVERTNSSPWNGVGDGALAPYGQMLRLVWSLVVGAVLIALAPRIFYRVADHAANVAAAGIWGTLGLVLVPVFALLALVSVLLLPVGVLALVLMPIALYLSQIVVGITIGRSILPRKWRDGSRGFLLFALVLGTIIIGALRMAPVPFLNVIMVVLVTVWGFGAILMLARDVSADRTRTRMQQSL
jgi:cytoskeletal protein CcmA (bactofilin family)